jgi:hypothetical protein
MNKIFYSALIIITVSAQLISQTSSDKLEKNKEISVMAGMTSTKLKNASIDKNDDITLDKKTGIDFTFQFSKYFGNRIGLGIGLGYSTYGRTYYHKGLYQLSNQIDKDGNNYDRLINADITYTDKLSYINVPLTVHLLLGNSSRFYGFIDAGIVNGFLIGQEHAEEGSKESMSKYPTQYNNLYILSQNDPDYGDVMTSVSKKETEYYKFYNMSVHIAVGVAASMTDRLMLKVKPFMNYGTSDISGKENKGRDYENILGQKSNYTKTSLFSAGINVGFTFNLN